MQIKIEEIKIGNRFRKDFGDLEPLKKSIKEIGLLHPIVINENKKLIAGERRLKAYKELKLKQIPVTKINLKEIIRGEYDENNVRKEFTVSEKVAIWEAMEKLISRNDKGQFQRSESEQRIDKPIKRAAKSMGISTDSLSKAKQIIDSGNIKLIEEMDKKNLVNPIYKKIKIERIKKELSKPKIKIEEEYEIIYADPSWSYNRNVGEGIASEEYSTLSLDKIKSFLEDNDIKSKENSLLFLWVTFPMLKEGIEVLESWGFRYKTLGFNWIKLNKNGKPFFGIGHYTKSNSEICLIGIKGKGLPIIDNTISQIIMTEKERHSKKPDIIPDLIVRLVGDRKRAELFARQKTKGWDVYGNEIKKDDTQTNREI